MATWSNSRSQRSNACVTRPMRTRLALILSIGALGAVACSQPAARSNDQSGASNWNPPRTAWGDPDLQGQWNNQSNTPLERPTDGPFAGRDTISDEEAETFYKTERRSFDEAPRAGDPGTYNSFWRDEGKPLTRTSMITD